MDKCFVIDINIGNLFIKNIYLNGKKIVLNSDSIAYYPKVRDLRVIALA